jgi:hypothetical protein
LTTHLWECPWPYPTRGPLEPLPEAQWRYFVIAFRGPNLTLGSFSRPPTSLEWNLKLPSRSYIRPISWGPDSDSILIAFFRFLGEHLTIGSSSSRSTVNGLLR